MDPIVFSLIVAAIYSMLVYVKKSVSETTEFDFVKFLSTIGVGAVVGLAAYSRGEVITEEYIQQQLVMYAGIIVFLENILKIMVRGITRLVKKE